MIIGLKKLIQTDSTWFAFLLILMRYPEVPFPTPQVKACIAKPQWKGQLPRKGFRGAFKVEKKTEDPSLRKESENAKQAGLSKMKSPEKSKRVRRKGKAVAEEKGKTPSQPKIIRGGNPNKLQSFTEVQFVGTPSKINGKKRNLSLKADGRGKRGGQPSHSQRPLKKQRGTSVS